MIAEEILMVMTRFEKGDIISLTTEDDYLLSKVEIRGLTLTHLMIGCPLHKREEKKIPWDDVTLIAHSGIKIYEELKGNPRSHDIQFLSVRDAEVQAEELLTLKVPGRKYITWSDPFTILVDCIKDISFNRKLFAIPEQRMEIAGAWELHSNGLWGLLSWDSEIVEIGKA